MGAEWLPSSSMAGSPLRNPPDLHVHILHAGLGIVNVVLVYGVATPEALASSLKVQKATDAVRLGKIA